MLTKPHFRDLFTNINDDQVFFAAYIKPSDLKHPGRNAAPLFLSMFVIRGKCVGKLLYRLKLGQPVRTSAGTMT